jgi:glycosyltransferase involved in cell wall biosynthesis
MSDKFPVTVIIPSYNSGYYLKDCIESINAGTRPLEILIVDDCSTDGSLELARFIEKTNDNVRVIAREKNGGIAEARRDGIFAATQEWIALVDADDLLEKNAISVAYETAVSTNTDICIWELWRFDDDREWVNIKNDPAQFPITGRQAAYMTLGEWKIHPLGVSKKTVYLEAYENFNETCTNADELITRLAFMQARSVSVCDKKYFYRVNLSSTTNTLHPRQLGILDSCLWLIDFCNNFCDAPVRKIVLGGIEQCWGFYKNRKTLGCKATKNKIGFFIGKLYRSGSLSSWIFQYPKHLIVLIVLKICCLGHD